jgi:hypothetical protein
MNAVLKTLILAGTLAIVTVATPTPVSARNPYWRGYWNWYDNTYQPYYYNYYGSNGAYYTPGYGGYYGPSYGGYNMGPYYNGGYYNGGYYNGPSGYYSGYGPGVGVQVGRGRLSFGWW